MLNGLYFDLYFVYTWGANLRFLSLACDSGVELKLANAWEI